ncbi:MAG: hypothetical protein GC180_02110 [Bacteroidetes bacterium]|nr:hypothetical protein [Bacteroidota bacterium]
MPKFKTLLVLVFIVLTASCSSSRKEREYFDRYHTDRPFVDDVNTDIALRLRKEYPKESFADVGSEILIEYYLDDNHDFHGSDSLMTTHLKARVTYYYTILSLHEAARFQFAVFYNKHMTTSKIMASYAPKELGENWFQPNTTDMSYEVDGYFYSDARLNSFSAYMPTVGTQLRFTYSQDYENVNYLTNVYFSESFPVKRRKIIVRAPEWLDLNTVVKNGKWVKTEKGMPNFSHIADYRRIHQRKEGLDYNWYDSYRGEKEKERVYQYRTYSLTNVKPRDAYAAEEGPTYYLPHLLIRVDKYKDKNGEVHHVMGNLDDLYSWYRRLVQSIGNKPEAVKEQAAKLTAGLHSDEEKVKAIFYWVQDNVRYLAFEDGLAGFKPEPCQMVYANRYGDCKGMANLLTEMLKSQGYDARLTWIGTRRIAYNYSEPSMAVDNHMICTLNLNGKRYFLDATEDLIGFGDYAHRIQGREVLIEDGASYILDSVPDLPAERNAVNIYADMHLDGAVLKGKVKESHKGESHTRIMRYFESKKSDRRKTALERYLNRQGLENTLSNIQQDSIFYRLGSTHFSYDIACNDLSLTTDSSVYLKVNFVELPYYSLQWDKSRQCGLSFSYKVKENHEIHVQIPDGWQVANLPDTVSVQSKSFSSLLYYSQAGIDLVMHASFEIPDGTVGWEERRDWENNRKLIHEFYSKYVVFIKK